MNFLQTATISILSFFLLLTKGNAVADNYDTTTTKKINKQHLRKQTTDIKNSSAEEQPSSMFNKEAEKPPSQEVWRKISTVAESPPPVAARQMTKVGYGIGYRAEVRDLCDYYGGSEESFDYLGGTIDVEVISGFPNNNVWY